LELDPQQRVVAQNRVIAKISRPEVAERFLSPAPESLVRPLVEQGLITPLQARLSRQGPMADDITGEADSGGHTGRRPQPVLLPTIRDQSESLRRRFAYEWPVRIGVAGGIGTPSAAFAAFALGADYIVTGSVNQASVEAGTSPAVKQLLAGAG